jgi:hypothetical protein
LNSPDIGTICKELFDEFHGRLSWKWDDWIGTILAEFDAARKEDVRASLEKFLPISWDSSNMENAPPIVQSIDKNLGGIRSGQLLFSSDPTQETFVFCAWWPWGSGTTISIRIAPYDKNLSETESNQLIEQLKSWAEI